jgi:hypothetical protein
MSNPGRREFTTPRDQYYNYCWWGYQPVAPTEHKLRPVSLLFQAFEVAGVDGHAGAVVDVLRDALGPFRTVWGTKWLGNRLAWEFYFYDYQRRERDVSITRVLDVIRPYVACDIRVNERLPYFMFSIDILAEPGSDLRGLDEVHMYVGNPGSAVSSGIAYSIRPGGATLENFYFFFDAQKDLKEATGKILCSPHVDATRIPIDWLLWPELKRCHTICVANKRQNDTVYFSGINVDQLLFFLKRLHYPPAIVGFVEENRAQLDHLLYDVGFDYITKDDQVRIVKSGYYGVF